MLTSFGFVVVDPVVDLDSVFPVVDLDSLFLVYCEHGVSVDGLEDVSVDDGEVTGVCNKQIQLSIII